jgi:two-component system OmpR family sensor kinase
VSGHAEKLEDLKMRFQSSSESLECSYRELQGRVQSLTAEIDRERKERIRLPHVPAPEGTSVFRLLEGIRAFLEPVAERKHIQIATECEADCFAVVDHQLLHRMLRNLVLNAQRETPRDGTISLKGLVAGSDVFIEVEDSGPGIQEERLARIFDPMFSASREGSVSGLPSSKISIPKNLDPTTSRAVIDRPCSSPSN